MLGNLCCSLFEVQTKIPGEQARALDWTADASKGKRSGPIYFLAISE